MPAPARLGPGPHLQPPKTVGAVVRQAREAIRRYRQDAAASRQAVEQPGQPQQQQQQQQQPGVLQLQGCRRMVLQLPLPVASAAAPGTPLMEQQYSVLDEGDWPGGIVQRFRALRPLVEATLEGYQPTFLGMLEDPADGMGCWTVGGDTTVVGLVTNATFASFAKLCQGGYGSKPLQPGHTLVSVNPEVTRAQDIGQFWETQLKAAAEQLLGPPWDVLYSATLVRTARGRSYGLLVGSWGAGWHLWAAGEDASSSVQERCLLWRPDRPGDAQVTGVLNDAAAAAAGSKARGGLAGLLDKMRPPR